MDRAVVNKLIRSEVWPLLRSQGFTEFESRTAYRRLGPITHVVTFLSVNAYHASVAECTTYSFAVHLGVHIRGAAEEWVPRDRKGRLRPRSCDCQSQAGLRKRSAVDGFKDAQMFYIDPSGSTTAACFREVCELVDSDVREWFAHQMDPAGMLAWLESRGREPRPTLEEFWPSGSHPEARVLLSLLSQEQAPSEERAKAARAAIEAKAAQQLDLREPRWSDAGRIEEKTQWMLELERRLAASCAAPVPPCPWPDRGESMGRCDQEPMPLSLKPLREELRALGFREFTDRLAHRACADRVDVVELAVPETHELKRWPHARAHFRLRVGVFWPALAEPGHFRINRACQPRPTVGECHLADYLLAAPGHCPAGRSVFHSRTEAARALATAPAWFDGWGEPDSAARQLALPDLEMVHAFPMLCGSGSRRSIRRLALLAFAHLRAGETDRAQALLREARELLAQATEPRIQRQGVLLEAAMAAAGR